MAASALVAEDVVGETVKARFPRQDHPAVGSHTDLGSVETEFALEKT